MEAAFFALGTALVISNPIISVLGILALGCLIVMGAIGLPILFAEWVYGLRHMTWHRIQPLLIGLVIFAPMIGLAIYDAYR